MLPKLILLDFDGVIVESVRIKDEAFEKLYQNYPQKLSQIMSYHLSHNATIRFIKFRYIAENILNEPYNTQKEIELSQQFSDLVFDRIVECPFVKGAIEFLDCFFLKVPLYLISISPEDELHKVLKLRDLIKYFKRVYSNPSTKSQVFRKILADEGLDALDVLYIGDSNEDFQAAEKVGIHFIGRKSNKTFSKKVNHVCSNMREVKDLVHYMDKYVN